MKQEFSFAPIETYAGTVHRPLVLVRVEYGGKQLTLQFLVDSGADFSLLSREFAEALGMSFEHGARREVSGIHSHAIDCVENKVLLTVPGFEKPFESKVCVSKQLKLVHNLLGRDNFFIQYRITLDQKERRLVLDDRKEN